MIILLFVVGYVYNNFTADKLADTSVDFDSALKEVENKSAMDQETDMTFEENIAENTDVAVVTDNNGESVEASGSSFFSEYRLEREKNRSKEVEMWEDIINNGTAEETFKHLAQQELVKIVELTDKEMIIENLIISRGFNDALVFLTDDSATVIVEAKELTTKDVAQIQDIVVRKTKLDAKNIKIMKKN
jgi:stage III sporulation protein AH